MCRAVVWNTVSYSDIEQCVRDCTMNKYNALEYNNNVRFLEVTLAHKKSRDCDGHAPSRSLCAA